MNLVFASDYRKYSSNFRFLKSFFMSALDNIFVLY